MSTAQHKLGEYTQVEKLDLTSKDVLSDNIAKIGQLFPEVLTESSDENGRLRPAIDFEKLRQFLSRDIVEGRESYEFTWVGKRGAIAEAGKPTTQTLRPDLEESVDFDKSENIFITGDNLEVLKVLQESYLGKIDMIYIDPPYNTGKDFVYSDKFQMSEEELADEMDLRDEDGLQRVGLTKNEKSSARYHSDWLNMMYPRLVLARNLLRDSGVIFISIDDNEISNIMNVSKEIYGDMNVDCLIWQKTDPWIDRNTNAKQVRRFLEFKEYILIVYKNKERTSFNKIKRKPDWKNSQKNIDNDPRGNWQSGIFSFQEGHKNEDSTSKSYFEIKTPGGQKYIRHWFCNDKNEYKELENSGFLYFGSDGNSAPRIKIFEDIEKDFILTSIMRGFGTSGSAKSEIEDIFFNREVFDTPKPSKLIKELVRTNTQTRATILDFFAGSATTADAVMQLNAEDGGNRKYILCTLDEQVADKSAAKEAGYATIDQISRERIRRAAKKIQKEHPERVGKQDFGFRAYKLDTSNFKDVSQTPDSFSQDILFDSVSNVKEDRTDLDLLIQIMLTWGMELSLPIAKTQIDGTDVYNVADGALIACFADEISESVLRQIAKEEPLRAVFKDESFANSAAKINLGQIFKEEAPNTKVKVV